MSRSAPRGRHAAPRRGWQAAVRPDTGRPARPGRHRAPSSGVGQPVAVVLLGVSATSFGLASVVPDAGEARTSTPVVRAALTTAVTVPAADTAVEASTLAARRTAAARAARRRTAAATAAPAPVDPLPGCRVAPGAALRYANGRIPLSALCTLPGQAGHALRADAARAFAALDQAYRARFGEPMCMTDSYRSLASQQALARVKPRLAARPGTSEHGYGVAVDLACGVEDYRSPQHRWLVANAGRFGWHQPAWARDGGRREEPWHWELRD